MYAVVRFVEEDTVSEVPDTWLQGTDKCWWPSKNAKYLIKKAVSPGSGHWSWRKHNVDIEGTCLSYEVARKKAINVSSSDENAKGRGKRQVTHTVDDDYRYDSDYEPSSVLTSIPKLPSGSILTKTTVIPTVQRKNVSCSQPQEGATTELEYKKTSSQPVFDIHNAQVITVEQFYKDNENCIESFTDVFQEEFSNLEIPEQPHANSEHLDIISESNTDSDHAKNSTDDRIFRLLVKMSLQLDSIDQRISKLEKQNRQNENDGNRFQFIKDLLPMTFDTITNVDSLLASNKDIVTQLKDFLSTVGGNSPRDNIHRILSQLFTNECATKCSWKGHRNNKPVFALKAILVMKEVLVGSYSYVTQHEIEQISAEWFRFAKQRHEREKGRGKQKAVE